MATYYMATDGDDGTGDGSIGNPWASLAYSMTELSAGDTLYIRGGHYYEEDISWTVSGTLGNIITIAAYQEEVPHFQPTGGSGWDFVRWYTAKNYLTFDGLEISGYEHTAVGVGWGSNITIKNCYFHDVGAYNAAAIFTGYYGATTNVIIENNIFEALGVDTTDHGIYPSRYSSNITISGNFFLGPISGYGVSVYSSSSPYPTNVKIYNNVFYLGTGSRRVPILIANGSGHEIYNNTMHVYAAGASLATHIRIYAAATVAAIKNNIFYGDYGAGFGYIYNPDEATIEAIDYNLYYPNAKDSDDTGAHSIETDPVFANAGARDYHLLAASTAREAGVTIGLVATDKDGKSRPQESNYDIGAFEHVVAGGGGGEPSGNQWDDDADVIAVWNLDDGALTADSKGTNTLSNTGVTADTVDYKQGDASGDFVRASGDFMQITDANLNSGFPLKSTESNKILSVCLWMRLTVLPSVAALEYGLFGKYNYTNSKRSFCIQLEEAGAEIDKVAMNLGYAAGASEEQVYHGTALVTGRWYHVGATFDDSTKAYRIRIWDDTAQAIHGSDLTGNFTNNIALTDVPVQIGNFNRPDTTNKDFDGELDEIVVFDRVLTTDEIDEIRQGVYGAITVPLAVFHYSMQGMRED